MENQRRRFEKKETIWRFWFCYFKFSRQYKERIFKNDEEIKNSPLKKKILDHMEIIYNDTLSILKKNNILKIHQAMMEIEDDSKPQGTIVQEIQRDI